MVLDKDKMMNDLDIYRDKFYPGINDNLIFLPYKYKPVINVFCANYREYTIAQALAPANCDVHFIFPEDIRFMVVENQVDEIERIFGYHGDKTKQTEDYESGRQMIRNVLLSKFYKENNENGKKI